MVVFIRFSPSLIGDRISRAFIVTRFWPLFSPFFRKTLVKLSLSLLFYFLCSYSCAFLSCRGMQTGNGQHIIIIHGKERKIIKLFSFPFQVSFAISAASRRVERRREWPEQRGGQRQARGRGAIRNFRAQSYGPCRYCRWLWWWTERSEAYAASVLVHLSKNGCRIMQLREWFFLSNR